MKSSRSVRPLIDSPLSFLRRVQSTSDEINQRSMDESPVYINEHSHTKNSPTADESMAVRISKSTDCYEEKKQLASKVELPLCLICLDPMNASDLAHPLMCTSPNCCYNFCCHCIESLIENKRQHQEQLNGYILLHCPNCRSDLGTTICDTILLRHVDWNVSCGSHVEENERERFLDLKIAMNADVTLLQKISEARNREARFFETKFTKSSTSSIHTDPPEQREPDEEWGFEVDIHHGAHETIKLPNEILEFSALSNWITADPTLLGGLEHTFPVDTQKQLTRYLTSGDTSKLAMAAEILSNAANSVYNLHKCNSNDTFDGLALDRSSDAGSTLTSIPSSVNASPNSFAKHRPTIYDWIEIGEKVRSRNDGSSSIESCDALKPPAFTPYVKSYTIKASRHRQLERQVREKLSYLKRYPLPVRMPKYAEFTIHLKGSPLVLETSQIVKSLPFRFCNDTWDGTVNDAFSKIYVSTNDLRRRRQTGKNYATVHSTSTFIDNYSVRRHKRIVSEGIRTILGGCNIVRIDTPHPRVLIASVVDSEASRQGCLKGDVLTHLNSVELRDSTVDDVIAMISSLFVVGHVLENRVDENNRKTKEIVTSATLKFVFNADQATSQALKMRAGSE